MWSESKHRAISDYTRIMGGNHTCTSSGLPRYDQLSNASRIQGDTCHSHFQTHHISHTEKLELTKPFTTVDCEILPFKFRKLSFKEPTISRIKSYCLIMYRRRKADTSCHPLERPTVTCTKMVN